MRPAISRQEWRQFRILARDSVRKLLNSAMLARDADPIQFAIWATALVATPPALYAFGQMVKYSALRAADPGVIERVVLADRMFFIVYSLIAAALLAAMTWDALYPDREEQEIIGALPVRPRTATAARLCAAIGVAIVFAFAINVPGAVSFSVVSVSHPTIGFLPVVLVAHLLATTSGCVTVFGFLLVVRGVVSLVLGAAVTDRLATGLQLVTIVALVEVFFYLPSILPVLIQLLATGSALAMWLPSTWFAALYSGLAGPRHLVYLREAGLGLIVLIGVLTVVVPLYLLPARVMARRALESHPGTGRRPWFRTTTQRVASLLAGTAPAAAVVQFSLLSLMRSRRHTLVVVTYAGIGIAFALIQVIASGLRGGVHVETPGRALLAVPLVLMFFVVIGIRAAFRIPRDLDANWVFKLHPPSTVEAAAGTRSALFLAGVVPIVAAAVIGMQTAGWTARTTGLVAALELISGAFLLECVLYRWWLVPFACAREEGQEAMQTRWLAAIGPFIAFTFGGATLQATGLRSGRFAAGLFLGLALLTLTVSLLRQTRARRAAIPFEGPVGHIEVLNLSEALH